MYKAVYWLRINILQKGKTIRQIDYPGMSSEKCNNVLRKYAPIIERGKFKYSWTVSETEDAPDEIFITLKDGAIWKQS